MIGKFYEVSDAYGSSCVQQNMNDATHTIATKPETSWRARQLRSTLTASQMPSCLTSFQSSEHSTSPHLFKQTSSSSSPKQTPRHLSVCPGCYVNSSSPAFEATWVEPSLQECMAIFIEIYLSNSKFAINSIMIQLKVYSCVLQLLQFSLEVMEASTVRQQ